MDDSQLRLVTLWFAVTLAFLGGGLLALRRSAAPEPVSVTADARAAWLDRPALLAAPLVMVVVSLTVPQVTGAASVVSSFSLFATRLAIVPDGMTRGLQLFRVLALVLLALTFEAAWTWPWS